MFEDGCGMLSLFTGFRQSISNSFFFPGHICCLCFGMCRKPNFLFRLQAVLSTYNPQTSTDMKKLLKFMGVAVVAAACFSLPNHDARGASQTATTTLTVTVPPYVVLYYPSNLTLVLADVGSNKAATADVSWTETDTNPNPTLTVSPFSAPYSASKSLTVPNIWAIRGISASGSATVAIAGTSNQTTTVSNSGTNIPISGLSVSSGSTGAATTIPVLLNGMTPVFGNVGMTLDMTALNSASAGVKSGNYTGGQYSITVTVN